MSLLSSVATETEGRGARQTGLLERVFEAIQHGKLRRSC
jgi:hypothetical protein